MAPPFGDSAMPRPRLGRAHTLSASALSPVVGRSIRTGARSSVPAAPETPQPDVVRVTLARYVVHEEDDGFGGHGVDLYMGYLMSGAVSGGGTSPVMGGLTKNNGGQPRNTHEMQQALFTVPLPAAGKEGEFAVAKLHLIESDQSTGLIQQAFNSAVVPTFNTVAPP